MSGPGQDAAQDPGESVSDTPTARQTAKLKREAAKQARAAARAETTAAGARDKASDELRKLLRGVAEVRDPHEAEEPVLEPGVRAALRGWLAELGQAAALKEVGVKPRATALLFGKPGCGKTTFAHHFAARLGLPLVIVGSEHIFASAWGAAENNVRRLFEALAAADSPAVVLLDEIDAIGKKRGFDSGGGAENARGSTLNVLLRRIEEFSGCLIGATNLPDVLDPALWRRFGLTIEIPLPGDAERWAILRRYAHPFDLGDEGFDLVCELTDGAAPSLLKALMEGVKRLLVLGHRIGLNAGDDPVATFATVIESARPHPDLTPPPLWDSARALERLAALPWPPLREDRP